VQAGLTGPNSAKAGAVGVNQIIFDDQSVITFENPDLLIEGILLGMRIGNFVGSIQIAYETHDLVCEIEINPKRKKFLGIFGRGSKLPSDHFTATIYRQNDGPDREILSKGKGSWLEYLEFDDEEIWNIFDPQDEWEYIQNLPSDSAYRKDLQMLAAGDNA
jgi:hypothetical protein